MVAQFEVALRDHAKWRAENEDPWDWSVSAHETGENLGAFSIRSGGHSWADFDAYDAGFAQQGLTHWNATVAPLVESISSAITSTNDALSNGPPANWSSFITVTRYHLRPGREAEFNRLVAQATELVRDKIEGYWVWSSSMTGGGPGPYMDLVSFAQNWSDMAAPDPSFEALMMQEMGAEAFQEWGTSIGQTYRGTVTYTIRRRPDMDVR